jgi:hypothetical protein
MHIPYYVAVSLSSSQDISVIYCLSVFSYLFVFYLQRGDTGMNSQAMELIGLQNNKKFFSDLPMTIGTLITDRHMSIAKWVRESWPEVTHLYDSWPVVKGKCLLT